jgi:hypothetical protein
LVDLLLDRSNARADAPSVALELRLARTSRADSAAKTRQRSAGAHEPRQQVLELRQLDLPLAFTCAGPPRKDIEYQLRAVHDLAIEPLLELPQLRWCQLVVEDHDVHSRFRARHRQRGRLAAADVGGGIRLWPVLHHTKHDDGSCAFGQARQLSQRSFRVDATMRARDETDQRCPFGLGWRHSLQ